MRVVVVDVTPRALLFVRFIAAILILSGLTVSFHPLSFFNFSIFELLVVLACDVELVEVGGFLDDGLFLLLSRGVFIFLIVYDYADVVDGRLLCRNR